MRRGKRGNAEGFDRDGLRSKVAAANRRLANPGILLTADDLIWLQQFADRVRQATDGVCEPSLTDLRCGSPYFMNSAAADAERFLDCKGRAVEEFAEACKIQGGGQDVADFAVTLLGEITVAHVRIQRGDFLSAIRRLWEVFGTDDASDVIIDRDDIESHSRAWLAFEAIRRGVRDRTALYLALAAHDRAARDLVLNLPVSRETPCVQRVRISAFNVGLKRIPTVIPTIDPVDVLELGIGNCRAHHDMLLASDAWLFKAALNDAVDDQEAHDGRSGQGNQSGQSGGGGAPDNRDISDLLDGPDPSDVPAPVTRRSRKSDRQATATVPAADPILNPDRATYSFDDQPRPGLSGEAGPLLEDGIRRHAVVVIAQMPGSGSGEVNAFARRLDEGGLLGQPVPLAETPDLAPVRSTLIGAWPHAKAAIDAVLKALTGRPWLAARPFLFVGPPGCGKTALAREIFTRLGLPHEVVNAGGSTDGTFGGTSRGWATGTPSAPLSSIIRHRIANPGFVLDEVEKAGVGRHNGNLHDVLLGMLEGSSAAAWRDPYVLAPVDISNVLWFGTANDADALPAPLRQRFRIVDVDAPRPEHVPALIGRIMEDLRQESGERREFMPDLAPFEIQAVTNAWVGAPIQGGRPSSPQPASAIRGLRRLVEGVLAARAQARLVN